jgi:hypothetical protein
VEPDWTYCEEFVDLWKYFSKRVPGLRIKYDHRSSNREELQGEHGHLVQQDGAMVRLMSPVQQEQEGGEVRVQRRVRGWMVGSLCERALHLPATATASLQLYMSPYCIPIPYYYYYYYTTTTHTHTTTPPPS